MRRTLVTIAAATGVLVAATLGAGPAQAAVPAHPMVMCAGFGGLDATNPWASVEAGYVTLSGHPAVKLISAAHVAWTANPYADSSWQAWLHSLKWTGDLLYTASGRHAGVTDAQRQTALNEAVTIFHDYVVANPAVLTAPTSWQRASAGNRAQSFACLIEALGPASSPSWLVAAAQAQANWLAQPANWLGAWNQGLEQDLGILTITCQLGPTSLRDYAVNRASSTMAVNIDPQGATTEQSTGYAVYQLALWQRLIDRMSQCGVAAPAAAQRVALVPDFLAWATNPAGTLEQLGDTVAQPTPDLVGTAAEYAATRGASGTAPAGRVQVYADTGYVFGRSAWSPFTTSDYYTLRFGPAVTMHGHYDKTSVTYWVGGRQLLSDSGHYGYTNTAVRDYLRSPEAHNEVSMAQYPGFRLAPDGATLVSQSQSGTADVYQVKDFPYAQNTTTGVHYVSRIRSVLVDRNPEVMVVFDQVGGAPAGTSIRDIWHLPAGMTLLSGGPSKVVYGDAAGHQTSVFLVGTASSPTIGKAVIARSYLAPQLNTTVSDYQTQYPVVGRSAYFMTVIAPSGDVAAAWNPTTRELQVTTQGATLLVHLSPTGDLSVG